MPGFKEKILYIGDKEFEDTFSNEVFARVLTRTHPKNNGKPWTIDEIYTLRQEKKFSDALIKAVAKECGLNYISKPELAAKLGSLIEVEEIPPVVIQLFKKARDIAGIKAVGEQPDLCLHDKDVVERFGTLTSLYCCLLVYS